MLFIITLIVNVASRLLIWSMNRPASAPPRGSPVGTATPEAQREARTLCRRWISTAIVWLCALAVLVALVPLALILFFVVTQASWR